VRTDDSLPETQYGLFTKLCIQTSVQVYFNGVYIVFLARAY
jgi:hypothetical protein